MGPYMEFLGANMKAFKYEKNNEESEAKALRDAKHHAAEHCKALGLPVPERFT